MKSPSPLQIIPSKHNNQTWCDIYNRLNVVLDYELVTTLDNELNFDANHHLSTLLIFDLQTELNNELGNEIERAE